MTDFNFKKKYGQNFLMDQNILNKIISLIKDRKDSLVLEIGCGSGNLTKKLCESFSYVAQELMTLNVPIVLFKRGAPSERIIKQKYEPSEIADLVTTDSLYDATVKMINKLK